MGQDRLSGLALMKVHRSITESLSVDSIINEFARIQPRRMTFDDILNEK